MEPGGRRWRGKALSGMAALMPGLALPVAGPPALAAEGPYLAVNAGGGFLQDIDDSDGFTSDFWPGPTVSGAVGYKWRWLRVEGEVFYAHFLLDDQAGPGGERPPPPPVCLLCGTTDVNGHIDALAFMANAYVDFALSDRVRLLAGGGVGGARLGAEYKFDVTVLGLPTDEEIDVVDDSDIVPAYQAKAGVAFALTDRTELYLGYRYFATADPNFDKKDGGSLKQDGLGAHIGEIGYRFFF